MVAQAGSQQAKPSRFKNLLAGGALLVLVLILVGLIYFCGWVFLQRVARLYRGHIYPNIYALNVDLSGLEPQEAAASLQTTCAQITDGTLKLIGPDEEWSYTWAEFGLHLSPEAMAQTAYAIGRIEDADGNTPSLLKLLLAPYDVVPRYTVDTETGKALLADLSTKVSTPPVNASVRLEGELIVPVAGQSGQMLDIDATLATLTAPKEHPEMVTMYLTFEEVDPEVSDATPIVDEAKALLDRQVTVSTYDVLTEETLTWDISRADIASWLHAARDETGTPIFKVTFEPVQATLANLAAGIGDGRGFRLKDATAQVISTFNAGGGEARVYLTHPTRTYTVESGDTITNIGTKFGMPPGLITEANPDINPNQLSVGQQITIPSQDILTPYLPVLNKKVVVSIAEQRMRVYENDTLLHDWIVSTGLPDSPTYQGTFQVVDKNENAYASQWDLWMPYFLAIYPAGGIVYNGIHELPINAGGQRLWAGYLGRPASFGCIILGIPDAETLYHWADIGVIVIVE